MQSRLPSIIKSRCDSRIYRHLKLKNGVRCILISDKDTDKSAASLDVKVGCSLDPKPLFGTAHFLEHMLFMGTDKYPSENEYSQFILNNGGMNNAYTSLTNTNYHFDCSNDAFEEALDRFAQFFICPNFSESGAEREVKAIDSEFNQSLQSDGWHFFNLTQRLSNKHSLFNRFNCGNIKSLNQDGMRQSLLDFHKKWYSSNIMNLTIVGRHEIDQLEQWVTDKFSPIENKNVVIPDLGTPNPFPKENLGKFVKFVPVKDKDILTLLWILPYIQSDIKAQPLGYFAFLFGHEGKNSLLSYLKSEGLANELSAGGDHELWSYSNFYIDISLTKKGLQNYEQVIEAVFQYANRIREVGPQQYIYQENNDLGKMQFEFSDKVNPVSYCVGLSSKMQILDDTNVDQILRSNFIIDEFSHDKLNMISKELCDTDKLNIMLRSKSFEQECDQVEEWYQTKYRVEEFSSQLLHKMKSPNLDFKGKQTLDIPPANNLIPTNFDILPKNEELNKIPVLLASTDAYDLWFKKDDTFDRPKSYVSLKIYTQDCNLGLAPEARVFVNIWAHMQNEFLREFNYMANCANLNLDVQPMYDSFNLVWSGFNHTMPTYIEESITQLQKMRQEVESEEAQSQKDMEEIFDHVKEKLLGDWKNLYYEQSYQQAFALFENLCINAAVEQHQMRNILKAYTFADFKRQMKDWFKTGRQCWYVTGNQDHEAAKELVAKSSALLDLQPIKIENLAPIRAIAIEDGHSFLIEKPLHDTTNENSCIVTYYEVGFQAGDELKQALTNSIVMQYLAEPFFNELRTQQQLGYVVFSRAVNMRDVIGAQFMVQSPKRSCEYIVNSINEFLVSMRQKVQELSDEDFEVQKQAVYVKVAEKNYNLHQEFGRFWGEICTHKYLFDRQEKQIQVLSEITKKDFQELFEATFFSKASKRIDLQLTSTAHTDEQEEFKKKNEEHQLFQEFMTRVPVKDSLVEFKKQSGMHPDLYKTNYVQHLMKINKQK